MSDNKTQPTDESVLDFLNNVENKTRREDGLKLLAMMEEITSDEAVLWGPSIVGFGQYHYVYASSREGDSMLAGFSPRKANLTVYIMLGFDHYTDLLKKLGKFKTSVSCLYINKLADVDEEVLRELIARSYKDTAAYWSEKS